jgi:predicted O-linked N-acetylglucosamine transferase (SPINDLY family)
MDELVKLAEAGCFEACERGAREWLRERRGDVAASYLLGLSLMRMGRLDESVGPLGVAAAQEPPQRDCVMNHADALFGCGRYVEGAREMARATRYYPECGRAHAKLAFMLMRCGMFVDAMESCLRAMQLEPRAGDVAALFGTCLTSLGRPEEAEAWFEKAAALEPTNYFVQGERAFHCNYVHGTTREEMLREHEWYGELVRRGWTRLHEREYDADPNRRLRVGVVSADLGDHPVARFLRGWLAHRDREQFELYAYSNLPREDECTAELKGLFTQWRAIRNMTDEAAAGLVREDAIDILIDVSGLTGGSRMRVMAARAAPVQMTYLGYPNTTGMSEIDYRIVDDLTDPAGADAWATEELLRMPAPFLCWTPPADAPEVRAREAGRGFTFGSFNYPGKMSEHALGLWRRVLEAVAGSRLLLKAKGFDEPKSRASVEKRLSECGLDLSRVELRGFADDLRSHMAHYQDVDVALDPFPYHGTTTTCEALWMGVPVVTLVGDRHASRVGLTILTAVGLGAMAARNEDHYVAIAGMLASRPAALAELRASLRARVAGSALCDAPGFARRFEGSLRAAWRQRVARRLFQRAA